MGLVSSHGLSFIVRSVTNGTISWIYANVHELNAVSTGLIVKKENQDLWHWKPILTFFCSSATRGPKICNYFTSTSTKAKNWTVVNFDCVNEMGNSPAGCPVSLLSYGSRDVFLNFKKWRHTCAKIVQWSNLRLSSVTEIVNQCPPNTRTRERSHKT